MKASAHVRCFFSLPTLTVLPFSLRVCCSMILNALPVGPAHIGPPELAIRLLAVRAGRNSGPFIAWRETCS